MCGEFAVGFWFIENGNKEKGKVGSKRRTGVGLLFLRITEESSWPTGFVFVDRERRGWVLPGAGNRIVACTFVCCTFVFCVLKYEILFT